MARDYGIEPYKRTDDERTKLDTKAEITMKMLEEVINELNNNPTDKLYLQIIEQIEEKQKLGNQFNELVHEYKD